jgi:dCTP deaminase
MSVLSKPQILKHLKEGNIIITPFIKENLSNTSYDVRLGEYFYRQNSIHYAKIINPFSREFVKKEFYPKVEKAIEVKKIKSQLNNFLNLNPNNKIILIAPGETILAHTIEFIGGRNGAENLPAITTEMRARSSLGRIGIAVCKCAGWGDVGYINRWTMEITNFSSGTIPLVVGMRIAQIIFHETFPIEEKDIYHKKGKYQKHFDIEKIKKEWSPEDMLPKLYIDKDLKKFNKYLK